jgi:hypothetical protein
MQVRVEASVSPGRIEQYRSLPESEGRILILIDEFSGSPKRPRVLEGRVKLAKLDFLIRYPQYLKRMLRYRNVPDDEWVSLSSETNPLQDRMIRYRYGPWDPSYYAVLGSLIGRGLVVAVPVQNGIGYRSTKDGHELASAISDEDAWGPLRERARVARRHFDYTGTSLKNWLYEAIPEMANSDWNEELS